MNNFDEAYDILCELKCEPKYKYLKVQALKDVRELIEKAKPKKPYVKHIKLTESSTHIVNACYCPTCKTNQYELKENYCYECGQRLDWEIKNEL